MAVQENDKTNELQNYYSRVEELEKEKQILIKHLLTERSAIDEQLNKLGYKPTSKGRPAGTKNKSKSANGSS